MNPILAQILATDQVIAPDGTPLRVHSGIPPIAGKMIQTWIAEHRPRRLVEIGLAYGISSLFICDALRQQDDISYHIIDPLQSSLWQSIGLHNLNRAGFSDRYRFHESPSELCLPRLVEQGLTFQFALIDGMHRFDHALVDFFYVNRMLEIDGILILDDFQMPAIRTLVAHISNYECYERLPVPDFFRVQERMLRMMNAPFRLAAFKKIAVDDRPWDWHREFV